MNSQNQQQSSRNRGDENGLTRRRMLQTLGTGAMAATVGSALSGRQSLGADGPVVGSEAVDLPHAVAPCRAV